MKQKLEIMSFKNSKPVIWEPPPPPPPPVPVVIDQPEKQADPSPIPVIVEVGKNINEEETHVVISEKPVEDQIALPPVPQNTENVKTVETPQISNNASRSKKK
jgi:hypothetical protein